MMQPFLHDRSRDQDAIRFTTLAGIDMMTRLPHSAKWKRVKKGGNRVCQHYKSHVLARHTHTRTIYNMHIYVFLLEICRGSLVCCLFCFLAHLGAIHHSRLKFPNMQASQRTKNSVTLALSFRKNVPRYEFFKGRACRRGCCTSWVGSWTRQAPLCPA